MAEKQNMKPEPWIEAAVQSGCRDVELRSWREFERYVEKMSGESPHLIYRGQANHDWTLRPKLDRLLQDLPEAGQKEIRRQHLEQFKLAIRGKRGPNPPELTTENDWWCLGQHHGLATPLLDWTESPFVALYFAFLEDTDKSGKARAVYAMEDGIVDAHSGYIKFTHELAEIGQRAKIEETSLEDQLMWDLRKTERAPAIIDVLRPATDENHRLVSQRALLTRGKEGINVEEWIQTSFPDHDLTILTKLSIPNEDRGSCLRSLNRMNINHMSLFPDLAGACEYCNVALSMKYSY